VGQRPQKTIVKHTADSGAAVGGMKQHKTVCPLFLCRQKAQRKSSQKETL